MDHRIIDLHVHSTESDGTLTPEDLVAEAKKAELAAFALTDHDTCQGVGKAMPLAASAGIELIPGIELSTDYHGKEVHIVGLYIDIENEQLLKKTTEYRKCRSERNALMVEALQKEGLSITMEELVAENPDCVITRANIARFLYEHGQIKSVREAFDRYIGDHCKCYVGRLKVASTDAVRLIKEAGGTAILAHPLLYGLSNTNLQKMIDALKPVGLDGLEAIYSTYTTGEEQQMKRLARENGLLISGGSDFHGSNKPDIALGRGRGHLYIPYSVLETIKAGR
ncbi:PHP domain-containing protein [Roseburia inulinivorans]